MRRSFVAVITLAFVIGACQPSAPTEPPLEDPAEILSKSMASLAAADSVEISGELSGQVAASGMPLDLEGARIDAAANLADGKMRLDVSVPTLGGSGVELIALDDTLYTKLSGAVAGLLGGDAGGRYTKSPLDSAGSPAAAAADPRATLRQLAALVALLPVTPRKAPDAECGDQSCYHLTMSLTRTDLEALTPDAEGLPESVDLELYSQKSDLRPTMLLVSVNDPQGLGTFRTQFTAAYDTNPAIEAPPPDQVVEQ